MCLRSLALVLLATAPAALSAPVDGLGFVATDPAGPGEAAARALATGSFGARVLAATADGALNIPADVRALWWHCERWPLPAPMDSPGAKQALLDWISRGGGLFLSGTALAYVVPLGLESSSPRVGPTAGDDTVTAGVWPNPPDHPVFAGFEPGQPVLLTGGGYPAFADFYPGGPAGAHVLGRAYGGTTEAPLVEYSCGKGRVIALGWRCPHYSKTGDQWRGNLERLTGNILAYLSRGEWFGTVEDAHTRSVRATLGRVDIDAMRRAVADLSETFGERYPRGREYSALIHRYAELSAKALAGDEGALAQAGELLPRLNAMMLDNPLLDFAELLLVKRSAGNLGLPANWESNSSLPRSGFDNEIDALSPLRPDGDLRTVYRPQRDVFVGDVDLHFDAGRMLFSSVADDGRWQVFESNLASTPPQPLPLIREPDVDNYDACYLPSDDIIFTSTAPFVGVPCVTGSAHVSNLYLYRRKTGQIRQLGFGQDHEWCPTVMPNGRVMYLRWEYTDIPHFVSRILFHMNPDGTEQMEYYGSNSYWPNSMFYARPIPGSTTRFVTVVVGHHDNPRMGELVLFDASKGKTETDGVIQRIPGWGKRVDPILLDGLTAGSWPKFLHPYPLSDKYFLVSCKPTPASDWGIYLVDVFDNLTLIKEVPGYALLEPIPLRPTPRPPVVADRVDATRKDALVYLTDVYAGPGLKGVPRGAIKKLRLFTYHFAYHNMGGQINRVGIDGPWDVKRIMGTVPVEADGSALFRVPANTPIAVQPLDEDGQALQLMRSWMTAMPGEVLSCVGCHEKQHTAPPTTATTMASTRGPAEITPWYGPTRGFSFVREVQPVLDHYCVSCHSGAAGAPEPDFRQAPLVHPPGPDNGYQQGSQFPPAYLALKPFVRNATIESDMHLLMPGEFAADTTRLIQMLRQGHYGVVLDPESWDRLITWIDLNTPAHGTWHEIVGHGLVDPMRDRRRAMLSRYAGIDEDPEAIWMPEGGVRPGEAGPPTSAAPVAAPEQRSGTPILTADRGAPAAGAMQSIDLGDGVTLELVYIPAGPFPMGPANPDDDGRPLAPERMDHAFWMGRFEVTNRQYAAFDPSHDSRLEEGDYLQFGIEERGYPVNAPEQPVVRVSWDAANAFCQWASRRTGLAIGLPTEAEWQYACRAGTATPLWFGQLDADFSPFANLADASLRAVDTYAPWGLPSGAIAPWRPAVETANDGYRASAPVGSYRPNPWGLYDMVGNVAEWVQAAYRPPHGPRDLRLALGGSWYDKPQRAQPTFRQGYPPYRGVYDVGFRVMCRAE